jgi:PAS domain S-box-containing protein
LPPDRFNEEADILRRVARGEFVHHFESVRIGKHGKSILVSISISPVRDAAGTIIGASKIARDITESRRIEQSVKEHEARLGAIIGSAMDAIITVDADQIITMFNPAAEAMFGCSASDVLGASLERFLPARFRAEHAEHILTFGQTQVTRRMGRMGSISGVRSTGEEFSVEASFSQTEVHGLKLFTVILRDVTERKRAEESLRQQAGLLDLTPVFVRDMDSNIILWTRGAERLYGYSNQEAIGRLSHDLLQTQFPAPLQQIEQTLHARGSWEGELAHRTRDGRQVFVHSHWVIHFDIQGQQAGILEVNADLTELRRTQGLQMRSQKLESLGTLAGGIAHDFNNILLALVGHTRLALEDLSPDSAIRQNLSEISKATARATDLVRRILTFSRPQEEVRQRQPLQPVVEEALKLVRATLPASIEIETSFSHDMPAVALDSTQLHQIIVNLATNAYHAIGDRPGTITVRLSSRVISRTDRVSAADLPEGRYVCLSVSDTGTGMDRATLDRIFDPFFTTKPFGQGTGLGLSVVHGIVASHGGAVTVQSQPGEGTSFHLYFPAAEVGSLVPDFAPLPTLPPARGSQENILYVDDEEGLVMLGSLFLQRLGYQVAGHVDAAAALYDFQSRPNFFAAVVTDLSMPRMSGFDLASEILKLRPGIPILMTSGYVRPEDQKTAEALGIARIISKPSTIDVLGQALADVLQHTTIVKAV